MASLAASERPGLPHVPSVPLPSPPRCAQSTTLIAAHDARGAQPASERTLCASAHPCACNRAYATFKTVTQASGLQHTRVSHSGEARPCATMNVRSLGAARRCAHAYQRRVCRALARTVWRAHCARRCATDDTAQRCAVPTPQPLRCAVPTPRPSLGAVPTSRACLGAVPTTWPCLGAVPTHRPFLAAVPTTRPPCAGGGGADARLSLRAPSPPGPRPRRCRSWRLRRRARRGCRRRAWPCRPAHRHGAAAPPRRRRGD